MQALILRGTELPVSLTYQEIPESEGSQYLRPNMENTSLVGGIIREIKGLELLKSWGLGDQAALWAKAEAVWRENVEARSSFHMQKLSTPLYQEKTSHSLMEVSKKTLNISVQHCLQLILCKKTDSVPLLVAWPLHWLTEEKEVWSAAVGTVPGPVSERIAFCTHRFQCLWSGEKGHTWSWAWNWAVLPCWGPVPQRGWKSFLAVSTQTCTASLMALPVWRWMLQLCLPRADSLQVVLALYSHQLLSHSRLTWKAMV